MSETTSQTPALWDGALEEARSLIGVELRRHDHSWNTEAHPDAVRHFCWGIGDDNKLFCDPEYGAGTRWKSGLAPGCFLYTIDSTIVAPKLRGIQRMYGGTSWEWYHPVRHRERLTTRVKLLDAVEKQGGRARSFIVQAGESLYCDEGGTLVGGRSAARRARRGPGPKAGCATSRGPRTAIRPKNWKRLARRCRPSNCEARCRGSGRRCATGTWCRRWSRDR
jgi:acyl dehydratase